MYVRGDVWQVGAEVEGYGEEAAHVDAAEEVAGGGLVPEGGEGGGEEVEGATYDRTYQRGSPDRLTERRSRSCAHAWQVGGPRRGPKSPPAPRARG